MDQKFLYFLHIFGKQTHVVNKLDKNILKLGSRVKMGGGGGGTKWDLILFRQTHPESVSRALKLPICQRIFTLFPKSQKILMMTSENAI